MTPANPQTTVIMEFWATGVARGLLASPANRSPARRCQLRRLAPAAGSPALAGRAQQVKVCGPVVVIGDQHVLAEDLLFQGGARVRSSLT
jgi:hypothetical protein